MTFTQILEEVHKKSEALQNAGFPRADCVCLGHQEMWTVRGYINQFASLRVQYSLTSNSFILDGFTFIPLLVESGIVVGYSHETNLP
jgi:hypothetical protein